MPLESSPNANAGHPSQVCDLPRDTTGGAAVAELAEGVTAPRPQRAVRADRGAGHLEQEGVSPGDLGDAGEPDRLGKELAGGGAVAELPADVVAPGPDPHLRAGHRHGSEAVAGYLGDAAQAGHRGRPVTFRRRPIAQLTGAVPAPAEQGSVRSHGEALRAAAGDLGDPGQARHRLGERLVVGGTVAQFSELVGPEAVQHRNGRRRPGRGGAAGQTLTRPSTLAMTSTTLTPLDLITHPVPARSFGSRDAMVVLNVAHA